MSNLLDSGSAFPHFDTPQAGMSLRDWFAGMAMQGMFAADTSESCISVERKASLAYVMADAMLDVRST